MLFTISEGVNLDFVAVPVQERPPARISLSKAQYAICGKEVESLLFKNAIKQVKNSEGSFLSSLFVIPKKGGGHRPIINLKPLNEFLRYEHFKMEGVKTVKEVIQVDDWLARLDLTDAYLTIPLADRDRRFVRFQWGSKTFEFTCLAFGLGPAPRIFTKLLRPVAAFLRTRGIRLVIYLDDILLANKNREKLEEEVEFTIELLEQLGFLVNREKSAVIPTKTITYLGLLIDSERMIFSLPTDKIDNLKKLCIKMVTNSNTSARELAVLLGNLNWAALAVPFARAHYRNLQCQQIASSNQNGWDQKMDLSSESLAELNWWIFHLSSKNGNTFSPLEPDVIIYSDASGSGWGAHSSGVTTRGPWNALQASRHINELELLAAEFALSAFTQQARSISVRLYLDNSTAVAYVNKRGGTRSKAMNEIFLRICNWCEERNIDLSAEFVPGVVNTIADAESRAKIDVGDWRLDPGIFRSLNSIWKMEVDLFASFWNRQLEVFVSWKIQPQALSTNAFALNWSDLKGYAFPPFALVGKCLEKIRREEADLVLVCPLWPSQHWFPLLMDLVCDAVRILPSEFQVLTGPRGEVHPLVAEGNLTLTAWNLSGKSWKTKAFREKWSKSSWTRSEVQQRRCTNRPGESGIIGVVNGIRIPYVQM